MADERTFHAGDLTTDHLGHVCEFDGPSPTAPLASVTHTLEHRDDGQFIVGMTRVELVGHAGEYFIDPDTLVRVAP